MADHEREIHKFYWRLFQHFVRIGSDCVLKSDIQPLLLSSKLDQEKLNQIWLLSTGNDGQNYLKMEQFILCMQLIALAQGGAGQFEKSDVANYIDPPKLDYPLGITVDSKKNSVPAKSQADHMSGANDISKEKSKRIQAMDQLYAMDYSSANIKKAIEKYEKEQKDSSGNYDINVLVDMLTEIESIPNDLKESDEKDAVFNSQVKQPRKLRNSISKEIDFDFAILDETDLPKSKDNELAVDYHNIPPRGVADQKILKEHKEYDEKKGVDEHWQNDGPHLRMDSLKKFVRFLAHPVSQNRKVRRYACAVGATIVSTGVHEWVIEYNINRQRGYHVFIGVSSPSLTQKDIPNFKVDPSDPERYNCSVNKLKQFSVVWDLIGETELIAGYPGSNSDDQTSKAKNEKEEEEEEDNESAQMDPRTKELITVTLDLYKMSLTFTATRQRLMLFTQHGLLKGKYQLLCCTKSPNDSFAIVSYHQRYDEEKIPEKDLFESKEHKHPSSELDSIAIPIPILQPDQIPQIDQIQKPEQLYEEKEEKDTKELDGSKEKNADQSTIVANLGEVSANIQLLLAQIEQFTQDFKGQEKLNMSNRYAREITRENLTLMLQQIEEIWVNFQEQMPLFLSQLEAFKGNIRKHEDYKDYKRWNSEQIAYYLCTAENSRFIKYLPEMTTGLSLLNVTGDKLHNLVKEQLTEIGVRNKEHRDKMYQYIQDLLHNNDS